MALIVQKFGGATIETPQKIAKVAARINDQVKTGDQLVVVVSAMGKTTDNLLKLAHELSVTPPLREIDTLLNTGEMISMALLTIALNEKNCAAVSLCGHQAGIQTDHFFSNASISDIDNRRITEALADHQVVVVAGFQGSTKNGDLTHSRAWGLRYDGPCSRGQSRCGSLRDTERCVSRFIRLIQGKCRKQILCTS